MLKNHFHLWGKVVCILLFIGIALSTIGFTLEKDASFLKEKGHHKWYQIIYIDQDNQLHIGITFDNGIQIGSIIS